MEAIRWRDPSSHLQHISPTSLFRIVARDDTICPLDLCLEAYGKAREPKELLVVLSTHFEVDDGKWLEVCIRRQAEFLKRKLCCSRVTNESSRSTGTGIFVACKAASILQRAMQCQCSPIITPLGSNLIRYTNLPLTDTLATLGIQRYPEASFSSRPVGAGMGAHISAL